MSRIPSLAVGPLFLYFEEPKFLSGLWANLTHAIMHLHHVAIKVSG